MARIPYADPSQPQAVPVADRIMQERGSVLHLYQMLLHSPPLAEGWLTFLTAIRQKLPLPGDLRELVIMRVAILNGAPYEAEQHAPIALAEGLSQAQLDALADWQDAQVYTPLQRDILALTDAMTRDIQVPEERIRVLREQLGEQMLVETVATIGAYNMVSRFLEALDIHSTDKR